MSSLLLRNGAAVLPDRILDHVSVCINGDRITSVSPGDEPSGAAAMVDLQSGYLLPGFVDLHVHDGAGADFMDGTEAVCRAHARHGTTSLPPTTTAARHDQHLTFLDLCRRVKVERRVVRMASLTPARICGFDKDIGSIEVGKRADFVVMDSALRVQQVYVGGKPCL